jgi:putative flippase GtrA
MCCIISLKKIKMEINMNATPKYQTFMILIIISAIMGVFWGAIIMYLFSGYNHIYLEITVGLGLLLISVLVYIYSSFKKIKPHI